MTAVGGLGPRDRALERLHAASAADPLDVLVIGGGITGAGIALDAATRGMSVGLVERFDFASGTSSKSSKLIHGGLRYLEQREFGLVREASTERELLGRLAPHLVEPIPFVIPISSRWRRAMFGVGLWTYDALASFKNLSIHRHLGAEETEELIPPLPKGKITGGYMFYDSKTDDARLVLSVLVEAVRRGAIVVNHAPVRDVDPSEDISCIFVEDTLTGSIFETYARRVVAASGVWTDRVETMAARESRIRLRPSKGIHLSFRRDVLPLADAAAFVPDAARERMLFVVPWLDAVIVGTTDTEYTGPLDRPVVTEDDRRYVIDALNASFGLDLTDEDVAGAYAGLRPLIAGKAGTTADLSRRHAVYDLAPGMVAITGGKMTTFRRMAQDAVDRVAADLGVTARSKTRWVRLGCSDLDALQAAVQRRSRRLGVGAESAADLIRAYGDRALAVLEIASEGDLAVSMGPGLTPIAAAAVYCARAEMAVHLGDLLARRTRLSITDPAAGVGPDSVAADLMASERGWTSAEKTRQIDAYRYEIERERGIPLSSRSPATSRVKTG